MKNGPKELCKQIKKLGGPAVSEAVGGAGDFMTVCPARENLSLRRAGQLGTILRVDGIRRMGDPSDT